MGKVKFIDVKVNRYCERCCYNDPSRTEECFNAGSNGIDECKFGRVGYYVEDKEEEGENDKSRKR